MLISIILLHNCEAAGHMHARLTQWQQKELLERSTYVYRHTCFTWKQVGCLSTPKGTLSSYNERNYSY